LKVSNWVAAMAFCLAAAANAQDPAGEDAISLERSSDWVLDYADHRCRLAATFGEGESQTVLLLEQYSPSNSLRWLVAGPYLGRLRNGRKLEVQFGPGFDPFTVEFDGRSFGRYGAAAHGQWPPSDYDDSEEAEDEVPANRARTRLDVGEGTGLRWIGLQRRGKARLKLETGELESIYGAMNSCMDDLVASWGLDPAQDRRRAKGPVFTNRDSVFRDLVRSYPNSALARGLQADLHLRLMVDQNGVATECVITNVTVAERFDDGACGPLMRRGKFEPARDDEGNAIPSYYTLFVYYRLG
jgi:hypothetical protein